MQLKSELSWFRLEQPVFHAPDSLVILHFYEQAGVLPARKRICKFLKLGGYASNVKALPCSYSWQVDFSISDTLCPILLQNLYKKISLHQGFYFKPLTDS